LSWHPLDHVPREPRTCIWELTRRCNLRCIHCENCCGERSDRELSREQIENAAQGLAALGCQHVHVTGGEPLLHPRWQELCRDFVRLGLRTSLITNGTLLDDDHLDRAIEAGVSAVGISVDGLQATHDSIRLRPGAGESPWRLAVDAVERAQARLETVVITAVNRRNLDELPRLRRTLAEIGVKRWQIQLVIPVGRALEIAEPFVLAPASLEQLMAFIADARRDGKPPHIDTSDTIGYFTEHELGVRGAPNTPALWTGCQAGIRAVAITYDGRVRGCSIMPPEFDAGDLHDESIATIWNDAERFAYSTRFDASKLTGACGRCKVGPLCRAGCTTMAYWTTGSIYSNPFCLHRVRGACA
jgi:radical SAM protein with 4Fe4S-binding SPASM domain